MGSISLKGTTLDTHIQIYIDQYNAFISEADSGFQSLEYL